MTHRTNAIDADAAAWLKVRQAAERWRKRRRVSPRTGREALMFHVSQLASLATPASVATVGPPPAVSVLLPVYNAEQYLEEAVRSILRQTFRDFELVAVDDGSTDHSAHILHRLAATDARMRVIPRPPMGIVAALNYGLTLCRAPLVARMDGDDIAMPDRLEKQVEFLDANPDHVLVGSQVLLIDEDGEPLYLKPETRFAHDEIDYDHLHDNWPVVHPAVMMRKDAVQKVGLYRRQYEWLEDLDLFLRLAEVGLLANLPDVLLHYRQHANSVCSTRNVEQASVRVMLYRETRQRRGLPEPIAAAAPKPTLMYELQRTWAWRALRAGNVASARKHALRAFKNDPLSMQSWRVVACAVRGH